MVEIVNTVDLKEWLEGRPREVSVAIAARSALRAAPYLSDLIGKSDERRNLDDDLTSWLISMLTSGVAGTCPTPEVKQAAAFAAAAADTAAAAADTAAAAADTAAAAANTAGFAAGSAAYASAYASASASAYAAADAAGSAAASAAYASASAAAFWTALSSDITLLEDGMEVSVLMQQPIWPEGAPDELTELTQAFLTYLSSKPELSFWARWYARMAKGDPPNWEMQTEIVLIENAEWRKGAARVAALIGEIEARYLAAATPYAEAIEVNPETGRLVAIPVTMENENLYQTALDKVRDALDDLRPNGELPQHCSALLPVVNKLERTLGRYSKNPQRVHDDFLASSKEVDRQLASKEVGDYPEVQGLRTDLITGSDDIRAADPVVRASVTARVQLRIQEMRVEDTEQAAGVLDQFADVSEGELAQSVSEDAEVLRAVRYVAESGAPEIETVDPSITVDALYRSAARVSRVDGALKKATEFVNKAADGYDRGQKLAALGRGVAGIVGWFLRLLMGG